MKKLFVCKLKGPNFLAAVWVIGQWRFRCWLFDNEITGQLHWDPLRSRVWGDKTKLHTFLSPVSVISWASYFSKFKESNEHKICYLKSPILTPLTWISKSFQYMFDNWSRRAAWMFLFSYSDFWKFLFLLVLQVAIKYIKKQKINDETEINRIRREIKIMSKLNHPNIINVREGEVMTPGVTIIMMSQTHRYLSYISVQIVHCIFLKIYSMQY